MNPKSRGRAPARARSPKRPHAPARQLTQLDHVLREAASLRECDLLVAQLLASAWLGVAWQARTLGQRDPEGDLVREVVRATRGRRADLAYLAVHALATIPAETWRADVVESLASAPPETDPAWAVDLIGRTPEAPVRARRWSDPWGSESVYLLQFAEPTEHSMLVLLTNVGGLYVNLLEVGAQGAEPDRVIGDLELIEVQPEEALAAIADALEQTDLYWPPQDDVDYTMHRALARWRTQGHHREADEWVPLPDDDRRRLLDDFLALQHGAVDPLTVEVLADTFIDFGEGYLPGGVLAWSPGEVEHFMLDWVHRKVMLEPDAIDALPRVLATWVRFALLRQGVAPKHVAIVVGQVTALKDQYLEASTDSSLSGPAKELMTRLVSQGIELSDRDAVAGAISAYNAEQDARGLF